MGTAGAPATGNVRALVPLGGTAPSRVRADDPRLAVVGAPTTAKVRQATRFHATVTLDSLRVGRDAGRIADEVIAHLTGLATAGVRVTLEIETDVPDGTPEQVVRTVTENCRTLRFGSFGFEEE